jgi:bifunctional N-acetylglucosamine-1-phosphate-uridyltransferase/glucosamine-1-phosphate-acetyltransferase GlmU-like protein
MVSRVADQPDRGAQSEQLGTGHAVMRVPSILDDHQVLLLLGDVPLVRTRTLQSLVNIRSRGVCAVHAVADDPSGYGRNRDERGEVARIVEEKDATDDERRVNEVNTGVIAFGAAELRRCSRRSTANNAQASTTDRRHCDVGATQSQSARIVVDSATGVLASTTGRNRTCGAHAAAPTARLMSRASRSRTLTRRRARPRTAGCDALTDVGACSRHR